jgi:protein-histidine pros-kinase
MKSLAGRMFLILVLATVAIQVLSFGGVLAITGHRARQQMYDFMASDVAFVQRFLRAQPPAQRADWLASLNRGYYELALQPAAHANPRTDDRRLTETAAPVRERLGPRESVLPVLIPDGTSHPIPAIEVGIDDVHKLLVSFPAKAPPFSPPPWFAVFGYLVVVTLVVMLVAWRAVRMATRTLSRFTAAARALGNNLDAPQVAEQGPTEVIALARSFNAMQRAIQANLDERTQILASISHDLKTPLTRLRLRVAEVAADEQRARLEADIDAMTALVQEGLDYAASARLREHRAPVDLNQLVEGIAERAADLQQRVDVNGRLARPLECAPRALERALQNLVDNAVKYGGAARIRLTDRGERIEIDVEDEGPGLPPDLLERVFDPFFRAEHSRSRETGGTGLGLAIARNLIRAQGGEIRLSNRPGGGLLARVELPAGSERQDAQRAAAAA